MINFILCINEHKIKSFEISDIDEKKYLNQIFIELFKEAYEDKSIKKDIDRLTNNYYQKNNRSVEFILKSTDTQEFKFDIDKNGKIRSLDAGYVSDTYLSIGILDELSRDGIVTWNGKTILFEPDCGRKFVRPANFDTLQSFIVFLNSPAVTGLVNLIALMGVAGSLKKLKKNIRNAKSTKKINIDWEPIVQDWFSRNLHPWQLYRLIVPKSEIQISKFSKYLNIDNQTLQILLYSLGYKKSLQSDDKWIKDFSESAEKKRKNWEKEIDNLTNI